MVDAGSPVPIESRVNQARAARLMMDVGADASDHLALLGLKYSSKAAT